MRTRQNQSQSRNRSRNPSKSRSRTNRTAIAEADRAIESDAITAASTDTTPTNVMPIRRRKEVTGQIDVVADRRAEMDVVVDVVIDAVVALHEEEDAEEIAVAELEEINAADVAVAVEDVSVASKDDSSRMGNRGQSVSRTGSASRNRC